MVTKTWLDLKTDEPDMSNKLHERNGQAAAAVDEDLFSFLIDDAFFQWFLHFNKNRNVQLIEQNDINVPNVNVCFS